MLLHRALVRTAVPARRPLAGQCQCATTGQFRAPGRAGECADSQRMPWDRAAPRGVPPGARALASAIAVAAAAAAATSADLPALPLPAAAPQRAVAAGAHPHPRSADCYIGEVHVAGAPSGPLAGLTAVVKDCFDVAGTHTSNGSPAWLATHGAAAAHAAAVQALVDAGAEVIGKNVMDEMAYSLAGENAHYGGWVGAPPETDALLCRRGSAIMTAAAPARAWPLPTRPPVLAGTPTNPAAPGRIPGGSSSGTVAAVAAGDADLGLGAHGCRCWCRE